MVLVVVLRWFLRWFLRATVEPWLRLFRYIFFFIDTTEQVFELHFKIILLTNNTHIHNKDTQTHKHTNTQQTTHIQTKRIAPSLAHIAGMAQLVRR